MHDLQIAIFKELFFPLRLAEKININAREVEIVRKFLNKLCHSHTDEVYQKTYGEFKASVNEHVAEYFDKKWHPIYKIKFHYYSFFCIVIPLLGLALMAFLFINGIPIQKFS